MTNIIKHCIKCDCILTDENWDIYAKKNYINKCKECLRQEKAEYRKKWYKKNKEKAKVIQKRSKEKLKAKNPVLYKCREMYQSAKKRARKKGMEFDLDIEFLVEIAPKKCPILEIDIDYTSTNKQKNAPSIDRIDSNKDYTKDNIQIISYLANLMKSNATIEEQIAFARYVLKKHNINNSKCSDLEV